MNETTVDAIFVYEYSSQGGHHWSNLPDDLWWNLITHFDSLGIDGVGFQDVSSAEALATCAVFESAAQYLFNARYEPYHGESSPDVAVFKLDKSVQRVLLAESFDQWQRANDALPFDELCFFRNHEIKIQAVPYENILLVYTLTSDEIRRLVEIDARCKCGLYSRDMRRLLAD